MKNRFFLCFRPITLETDSDSSQPPIIDCSKGDFCTYISVSKEQQKTVPTTKPTPAHQQRQPQKRNSHNAFSAIFFEISRGKRVRSRNVRQPSINSDRSDTKSGKSLDPKLVEEDNHQRNTTNSLISSTSLFSPNSILSSSSEKQDSQSLSNKAALSGSQSNVSISDNDHFTSNFGLYFLVVTLFVTVCCGRICAIIFTSIYLYLFSGRRDSNQRPENVAGSLEMEELSVVYKKRVIMEGLLERNHHNRGALNFKT